MVIQHLLSGKIYNEILILCIGNDVLAGSKY